MKTSISELLRYIPVSRSEVLASLYLCFVLVLIERAFSGFDETEGIDSDSDEKDEMRQTDSNSKVYV